MTIYLDPRAGSSELLTHISPRPQLLQLDSGDVMFPGNGPNGRVLVGVEVKKLGDALQCMQDGRLVSQMARMHEDYDYCYFVLQDEIRCDRDGYLQRHVRKQQKSGKWSDFWADAIFGNSQKMMYADFMRWMTTLSVIGGMRTYRTNDAAETGAYVGALYGWFRKDWADHKSLQVFDDSSKPTLVRPSIPAEVAKKLAEGIGWDKAMAVAEHFGTVIKMANATKDEWLEIPGIGKEIATRAFNGARTVHAVRTRKRQGPPVRDLQHADPRGRSRRVRKV